MNDKFKKVKCFLFFILFMPLTSWTHAETNLTELVYKVKKAIVTIQTYDHNKNPLGQGTGFFFNNALITNYHVLIGAHHAEIITHDSKKYPIIQVFAENKKMDILKLIVQIPQSSAQELNSIKFLPSIAERIIVIGSPLGLAQTVSEGIISNVRKVPELGTVYQISAPISMGSSGSPVLNLKGEVVGIVSFYLLKGQNLNFAIPVENIFSLEPSKNKKSVSEWTMQAEEQIRQKNFQKGTTHMMMGEYEEAIEPLKECVRISYVKPVCPLCLMQLGEAYFHVKDYTKALVIFKELREKGLLRYAHFWIGRCYYSLDLFSQAIDELKKAINYLSDTEKHIYADDDMANKTYTLLGFSYAHLNLFTAAIESFKQAIDINPMDSFNHLNLGAAYLANGNKGLAIEQYKILRDINIERADILFDLIFK